MSYEVLMTIALLLAQGAVVDPLQSENLTREVPLLCGRLGSSVVDPMLGRRGDGWPKRIQGIGIVRSMETNTCAGFACDLGHILIEIQTTDTKYNADTLFGFKSCISGDDVAKLCNRKVKFTAEKTRRSQPPCGVTKSFDSMDVPFYMVRNLELAE